MSNLAKTTIVETNVQFMAQTAAKIGFEVILLKNSGSFAKKISV